jgi:poly-gamma-glutamate capsule biosynthesis protein CapA/YwtB (metallophosphatase superfamily)
MAKSITIAITGDSIINRRISVFKEEESLSLINVIRQADVAYTHLETIIHDYEGPELYPSAEAGWTWMRSPRFVADELRWAGFDMVSVASNHALDYSYGGLYSTWKALDDAGLVHAGTGRNLAEAREPAYLDTEKGRIALISMSSTFTSWSRAGESRPDMRGRPGVNPLRYYYIVDSEILQDIKQLFTKLGWWIRNIDDEWLVHPPGLHHAITKFKEGHQPGISTAVNEEDAEGNLRAIRVARERADRVLVHLHNHEWHPGIGLSAPAKFASDFARTCLDSDADLFVASGSHSLLRGIEIYKNRPIFYDPGDLMSMADSVTKLPADFYFSPAFKKDELRRRTATPVDAFEARRALPKPLNPPGGYHSARVLGSVVALCSFDKTSRLDNLTLFPVTLTGKPASQSGRPTMASKEMGEKIINYLGELSAAFGTQIEYKDGVGVVKL